MTADAQAQYIAALIELHRGLERKGPGDSTFSRYILSTLSPLPLKPRIADLGCGSGVSALLLAQHFQSSVLAVDSCLVFIEELRSHIQQLGLGHLITVVHGDMGMLDRSVGEFDLLWSEGAAYNLGFEQALKVWRPLLTSHGVAVLSELSWFTDNAPKPAVAYWQNAYPAMATEAENSDRAKRAGFSVVSTHRLPSQAWWDNYYGPLRQSMQNIRITPALQSVIDETQEEIGMFEQFSESYGYTFYILRAV